MCGFLGTTDHRQPAGRTIDAVAASVAVQGNDRGDLEQFPDGVFTGC